HPERILLCEWLLGLFALQSWVAVCPCLLGGRVRWRLWLWLLPSAKHYQHRAVDRQSGRVSPLWALLLWQLGRRLSGVAPTLGLQLQSLGLSRRWLLWLRSALVVLPLVQPRQLEQQLVERPQQLVRQ